MRACLIGPFLSETLAPFLGAGAAGALRQMPGMGGHALSALAAERVAQFRKEYGDG